MTSTRKRNHKPDVDLNSGTVENTIETVTDSGNKPFLKKISFPAITSGINQYVIAVIVVILVAVICSFVKSYIGYQSVSFILLLVVAILATLMGIGPILLASTFSALIWNYLFIPPMYTFHIHKPEDVLMLGMFFIIALLNGVLTSRVRRQEQLSREREERTNALYRLTYGLVKANGMNETLQVARLYIQKHFSLETLFILQDGQNNLQQYKDGKKIIPITADEFNVAVWTFRNSKKAGRFTETLPLIGDTFYPLPGTRIKPGVVMVQLKKPLTGEKEDFWNTFLAQISIAIEREFLTDMALKANLLDESDKLYKALFNSISHELRIPVSTIMGASDTLLLNHYSDEVKKELCEEIFKASQRLNRLIENLLNMSRLESGHLKPRFDWSDVHDLVNKVTNDLEEELKPYNLLVDIDDNIPVVKLDFGLMQQVLYNLLFNAIQHAPEGTAIRIRAFHAQGNFVLIIRDQGPGFRAEDIPMLFHKFYRAEEGKSGGIGLGLSIVKGFVEAHKGTITAENNPTGGAMFTIKIPAEVSTLNTIE